MADKEARCLRGQAAVVGIGATEFSKASGRSELQLACEAVLAACDDAGLAASEIDGMVRYTQESTSEVAMVSALGLPNLRYFCEVGYGGSAHCAVVGHAALAVSLGLANVVVCFRALNERSGRRFGQSSAGSVIQGVGAFEGPYGMLAPIHKFGLFARRHMIEYGTTSEQFGMVAVAMRDCATRNPAAMMKDRPMTLSDHQASRMVCDPLRLYDCCLESDGAVAILVTSSERARSLRKTPAYIKGFSQATGPDPNGIIYRPSLSVSEAQLAARDVYAMAGVGPEEIDVAEFYDHFSPFVIFAIESFGFCDVGDGGRFVEDGGIGWPTGQLPVNTHGGNLSEAYIHGLTHVAEGVRQIRGESTSQVQGASNVLVGSAVGQVSSALILGAEWK